MFTQSLPFADIQGTAEFALIEQTARQIAGWGGIKSLLEQVGVASSEIPVASDAIPEDFVTVDEGVGVLFGMTAKGRPKNVKDTPLSPVLMVPVTALLPAEVAKAAESKAARDRLAKELRDCGNRHLTNFERKSVV